MEATISTRDLTADLLAGWLSTSSRSQPAIGLSVGDALEQAGELRRRISRAANLDLSNQEEVADELHALCRLLLDECIDSPRSALRDSTVVRQELLQCRWVDDLFHEREGLINTLTFVCWRASRMLEATREAQEWETEYRRSCRSSLDWQIEKKLWSRTKKWQGLRVSDLPQLGPEAVFRTLVCLYDLSETDPRGTGTKASILYEGLQRDKAFALDLRSYFQGTAARLVGMALRASGKYDEASRWLSQAESHFRDGPNHEPEVARILFVRLTISYAISQPAPILRHASALADRLNAFSMDEDSAKCRFLLACALKMSGQPEAALKNLEALRGMSPPISPRMMGWVLGEIGDIHGICGNYDIAFQELAKAANLLRREGQFTGLAHVNSMIGTMCRARGLFAAAVELFASSVTDFNRLGMTVSVAYTRLLIAETYLAMNRPADATEEVLGALPVLEDAGVVPDAVAALSILRESIRRQKLDPQILRDLRERLNPGSK